MGDFDEYPEILEALGKLEFMCGTFQGTRRLWLKWGDVVRADAAEWHAAWVLDGYYLHESSSPPHGLHYWGYDHLAKQYRRWSFTHYGHFVREFPDPYSWIGTFEGDSLVMTVEYESVTPAGLAMHGQTRSTPDLPTKLQYTPGPEGSFTVTQHLRKGSPEGAESFPGYYMGAETAYQRQASSSAEGPEHQAAVAGS